MNKRMKIAISVLLAAVALVFIVFLASVIIAEMDFKKSLPNPDEATEMYLHLYTDGTYLFVDDDKNDVVVPCITSNYGTFLASCGSSINNMVLPNLDEQYIQLLSSMQKYATIERIFLPTKATKEFKDKILALYPECELVDASKGDKLVSGQYVLRFYSSSEEGCLHLTHGYSTFLVGGAGKIGALKGDDITVALLPDEALLGSGINATYAVTEGDVNTAGTYGEVAMNVASRPSYNAFCLSTGDTVLFDFGFEVTGKLAQ